MNPAGDDVTHIVLDLGKFDSDMPHVLRDTAKRHREGRTGGYNVTAPDFLGLIADQIENPSPLIVLDLCEGVRRDYVLEILRAARHGWTHDVADQIEAQTKPARIPEPGLYGVVYAHALGAQIRQLFIKVLEDESLCWIDVEDATGVDWDDLIDPTLVREGLS